MVSIHNINTRAYIAGIKVLTPGPSTIDTWWVSYDDNSLYTKVAILSIPYTRTPLPKYKCYRIVLL